jgi:hypothetical protein
VKTKIPLEMVNQALYKAFLARSWTK